MELKFKPKPADYEPIPIDDVLYDYQYGGYINLDDLLEKESAEKVRKAFELIVKFSEQAIEKGYIEII